MPHPTSQLTLHLFTWTLWTVQKRLFFSVIILVFTLVALHKPIFFFWVLWLVAFTAKFAICRFDKTRGQLTLQRHSILGAKVFEHPIQDVVDVDVLAYKHKRKRYYQVNLMLVGDRVLPLWVNPPGDNKQAAEAIAYQIRSFLRL